MSNDIKIIRIKQFKKIKDIEIKLDKVNILVGGNNSGKSSVLQCIHFKIMAAAMARQKSMLTFRYDDVLFNPISDFTKLRHGEDYSQQNFSSIEFTDVNDKKYKIDVYKGRNFGNIKVERSGDYLSIGNLLTDSKKPYSVYVPGLAGISHKEELKPISLVRKAVARGDANSYFKNILYYLEKENKLPALNKLLKSVFLEIEIKKVSDDDISDFIEFNCIIDNKPIPIELVGTGILQAIQMFAYIEFFKPKLLLLDEPDSHLHPENQKMLMDVIGEIAFTYDTQVLISTHSKVIIDSMIGTANFIWMNSGCVVEVGREIDKISMLMELGALDKFEALSNGMISHILLTEDRDKKYIKTLLKAHELNENTIFIHSYLNSANLEYIEIAIGFLKELAKGAKVVVHRDRDFMTDFECTLMKQKIERAGGISFITSGSDIESYFVNLNHVVKCSSLTLDEIEQEYEDVIKNSTVKLIENFCNKRGEIKRKLYKGDSKKYFDSNRIVYPETEELISDNKIELKHIKGKFFIGKVHELLNEKRKLGVNLNQVSEFLFDEDLLQVFKI